MLKAVVTDEEFDSALQENRHKELIALLRRIAQSSEKDTTEEVIAVLEKNGVLLQSLIQSLPEVPAPIDNQPLIASINTLMNNILLGMRSLKLSIENRPNSWRHEVIRDSGGFISTVISTVNTKSDS